MRKMQQVIRSAVSASIGITLIGTFGLEAYSADLLDIYQLALRNDPTFEVARYTLKAAQEKTPQARAGLLPTVNASGSNHLTGAKNQFSNAMDSSRDVHAWNWTLQLTQPLIRMQNVYAYDAAKVVLEQAQAQFNQAEQDMILRITRAYFGVMVGRAGIAVAEAELSATEAQLELAKRGFEKGVAAITEVKEGQSRADLARAHLVAAKNELDAFSAELGKIVDEVPQQLSALGANATIPLPQPNDQQFWIDQARESNPAIRAAESGLLVAEAIVGKTRSEHTPTLDLVASYGENYSSGNATMPSDFAWKGQTRQIGVQFNAPLFAGGGTSSHVSEAIANKYRAGAELEVARRQAATDARQAYAGVVNGLAQITALESAVLSSQSMVDESHAGYKLGIYNNVKVLDAEQQLYAAKRDLIKARYQTLFQALKLKAATGSLGVADLIGTNALLER